MTEPTVVEIYGENYNKVIDIEGKERTIDPVLAGNLLMKFYWTKYYKQDLVVFIDGSEGSGKSTLARSIGKLLDPQFDHTKIFYDFNSLKNAFYNDKDWEVILYDESQEGMDRRATAGKANREMAAFFRQARQAHKIVLFCGPSIYDIDSYISLHRVSILLHCYMRDGLHPGHGLYFSKEAIKKLYVFDKKTRDYNQKASFPFYFSNLEVCDMDAYNRRKKAAFMKFKPGVTHYDERDADLRQAWEIRAVNNCIELELPDSPIYMALGIPKRSWQKMKKKQKQIQNPSPIPERGPGKRAAISALESVKTAYTQNAEATANIILNLTEPESSTQHPIKP